MGSRIFGGLTLKQLALRTFKESNEDNVFGGAAELAYYFLLALFPMLIFLTSMVGFMPGLQQSIMSGLAKALPPDAMKLVSDTLDDVVSHRSGGLISFGVLGTIWAASSGVSSLMGTLNTAYDAEEQRPFWKVRLYAIGLTVALALLVTGGAVLIMFAHNFADWLATTVGLNSVFAVLGSVVGYVVGLAALFIGIELLYYFGPNVKQRWSWITPGAVFAAAGVIVGSMLFSLYIHFGPSNSATYGSLGAVITLMLWLYLLGLVLLVGGEINSEIEHATRKPMKEKKSGKPTDHLQAA